MKTLGLIPSKENSGFDVVRMTDKKVVGQMKMSDCRWVWKLFGCHPSASETLAGAQEEAEVHYNRLFG